MYTLLINLFASTYGSGTYNTSTYNGATAGGSVLTNTGIAVAAIVAIAATILLVALAVRIFKRRKSPIEPDEK